MFTCIDINVLFIFGLILLALLLSFIIVVGLSIINISACLNDIRNLEVKKWKENHKKR